MAFERTQNFCETGLKVIQLNQPELSLFKKRKSKPPKNMLNVITKYKKESHDGMKRAACNERKKGWHLSAQCAFCRHDTPQTGRMEFR